MTIPESKQICPEDAPHPSIYQCPDCAITDGRLVLCAPHRAEEARKKLCPKCKGPLDYDGYCFRACDHIPMSEGEKILRNWLEAGIRPVENSELREALDDFDKAAGELDAVSSRASTVARQSQANDKLAAARSKVEELFASLQREAPQNEAERELLQKYRGWSESGEGLATTNAGVFVSYPEWNRREAEISSLRADRLTKEEARFLSFCEAMIEGHQEEFAARSNGANVTALLAKLSRISGGDAV